MQDVAQLVVGLARDAYSTLLDSRKFVWNWLKAHWGDLHAKLGGRSHTKCWGLLESLGMRRKGLYLF